MDLLYNFALKCFRFYTKANCNLRLIPMSMSTEGKLETASVKSLILYFAILGLLLLSMVHKMVYTAVRIASRKLDVITFVCTTEFLIFLVSFSASTSCTFLPDETKGLVNHLPEMLAYFVEQNFTSAVSVIGNIKTAVAVVSLALMSVLISLAAAGLSVSNSAYPTSLVLAIKSARLILTETEITLAVSIFLVFPLQFISYALPMLRSGWSCMVVLILIMINRDCVDCLR